MERFRALLVGHLGGEPLPRGAIADFARETGVRDHVISRWLDRTQPRRPSPENLERIAPALGMSYDDLMALVYETRPIAAKGEPGDKSGLHPKLAAFLADVEAAWLAADEQVRDMGERTTRAVFKIEDTRRLPPSRRQRVTKDDKPFGRDNDEEHEHPKVRRSYDYVPNWMRQAYETSAAPA